MGLRVGRVRIDDRVDEKDVLIFEVHNTSTDAEVAGDQHMMTAFVGDQTDMMEEFVEEG